MKIQHKLIIDRWEKISTVKSIPVASEFKTFFEEIFENGYTLNFTTNDYVIRMLRGFKFNKADEIKDEIDYSNEHFKFCFCLDLHSVEMSEGIAEIFDKYLMDECRPYQNFDKTFFDFWIDVLNSEKSKSKKKSRKKVSSSYRFDNTEKGVILC